MEFKRQMMATMQSGRPFPVDCNDQQAAMFVLVWILSGLTLSQTLGLSSQLDGPQHGGYGTFSFVQSDPEYTVGTAVVHSAESDDESATAERHLRMLTVSRENLPVKCTDRDMTVTLPAGPLSGVRILGK